MRMRHPLIMHESVRILVLCITAGAVCVYLFFPPRYYRGMDNISGKSYSDAVLYVELKDILSVPGNGVLLVDLRGKEQFEYAHLPNSINLPEPWIAADIENIVKPAGGGVRQIVIVNLKSNSGKSVEFYRLLKEMDLAGVAVYSGGWEEWKACNLPVEGDHA